MADRGKCRHLLAESRTNPNDAGERGENFLSKRYFLKRFFFAIRNISWSYLVPGIVFKYFWNCSKGFYMWDISATYSFSHAVSPHVTCCHLAAAAGTTTLLYLYPFTQIIIIITNSNNNCRKNNETFDNSTNTEKRK